MNDSRQVLELLSGKSSIGTYIGTFVSTDGSSVIVDTGGGRIPVKPATDYRPEVGEAVVVLFIDGTPWYLGPSTTKPGTGSITDVTGGLATVSTDIGSVTATYGSGMTLSSGQTVKLLWSEGAHIVSVLTTTKPVTAPPDAPADVPGLHIDTFTALDAGSGSTAAWTGWTQPQVWAAPSSVGAWFYGSKITDTLADAVIQGVELFVATDQLAGIPVLGLHDYAAKPTDPPVITDTTAVPVDDGTWVPLPLAFGEFLATNIGGIGVLHGGPAKFKSLAQDPGSGRLRFTSIY
ncbi:hypothetical protein [Frondihabitans sp. VKM Ac-2883]|uniref:hypothetical protein n=1 Tax=Frondihabitans sp. VKM Ac-2883 TaxID=2783823 RepID=UPI00188D86DC|nr:hypothetical protein [Frondihabitans sp. VKM Ac-2883]MBF4574668.1 hypothetical protein [Frondihabitans sp. VKM Ac-2883]